MEFIFVFYEWCFAILAIRLHFKIREKASLFLAIGLTTMSVLITVVRTAKYLHVENVLVSKVVPFIMIFVPMLTISGFFLLVRNWGKIKSE